MSGSHQWLECFVVDLEEVGREGYLSFGVGEHDGDDLALVADLFLGDGESLRDVLLLCDESRWGGMRTRELTLEVASGVYTGHARRLARVGDVDALDARVREGTPDKSRVCSALAREVVDVVAVTCDQARVFAAVDLGSDQVRDRHVSCPPRRPWASFPSRPSSSWG